MGKISLLMMVLPYNEQLMKLSLEKTALLNYVNCHLQHFFPDGNQHHEVLSSIFDKAIERLTYCFSNINRKYYQQDKKTEFNHLNSDHYASFIYLLSNEAWQDDAIYLAEKLFYLNKALNGLDCFYSVKLPKVFMFVHPVGTVLGHADYADYLVIYQNVTVGSTLDGIYPIFAEGCVLYAKSSVIGRCNIGRNVVIGANAFVLNTDVEHDHIIVGHYPDNKTKLSTIYVEKDVFNLER